MLLSFALLARPTFGWVVVINLPLGGICLVGRHVFLEYMTFRMTCYTGTFVIREVMLFRKTCLKECTSSAWHIFQEDVYLWNTCFERGEVLLMDISYRKPCLIDIHVLQEYLLYRMAYYT